jgi:hypothetical protein
MEKNNADMDVTCKFDTYLKNQISYQKMQNFDDFKTVEKVAKNAHRKSYKETNLMNIRKSGKSTFFRHSFVNNFLCVNLFATFSTVLK